MTPEDVAKLESLGTMAFSPDGSRIAFTTSSLPDVTEGEKNGSSKSQLKIATAPNVTREYLPKDISPGDVDFTPDGRMITFTWSKDDEKTAVWGVPVDGGSYMKLAALEDMNVLDYRFSPDGSSVIMLARATEDEQREKQSDAGFNSRVYEEEFKPNRLFVAAPASYTMDGTIDTTPREIELPGFVSAFDLSPDGSTILVESAPTPLVDDSYTSKRVNLIDAATGAVKTVVETPGKIGDAEFSPDGSQLY